MRNSMKTMQITSLFRVSNNYFYYIIRKWIIYPGFFFLCVIQHSWHKNYCDETFRVPTLNKCTLYMGELSKQINGNISEWLKRYKEEWTQLDSAWVRVGKCWSSLSEQFRPLKSGAVFMKAWKEKGPPFGNLSQCHFLQRFSSEN